MLLCRRRCHVVFVALTIAFPASNEIGRALAQDRAIPSPAGSAPIDGEPAATGSTRAFDRYVVQGGWVTIFGLIPLSIAALALAIHYYLETRRDLIVPPALVRELEVLFVSKQYGEALARTKAGRSALSYVIQRGLTGARDGVAAMDLGMQEALEERATVLHRKIERLNLIGSVAPMIGLFGTVHGIIGMFGSIADTGGVPIMSRISHDLGTALVATFWGLLIAIPSLTVFGLLRNRIDLLMGECAQTAESLTARFRTPSDTLPETGPVPQAPVGPKPSVKRVMA